MASDLIELCGHLRPILPRSLHLPLASTDGSRTRNLNKNGVRLWSDCGLESKCLPGRSAGFGSGSGFKHRTRCAMQQALGGCEDLRETRS